MAHFAELDQNNLVLRVVVIANEDCHDDDGNESEAVGVEFCKSLFGENTIWKQTSYNGNFRLRYAGTGGRYDSVRDAFILPRPLPSWTLNTDTLDWEPPLPYPNDGNFYQWNESTRTWDLVDAGDS